MRLFVFVVVLGVALMPCGAQPGGKKESVLFTVAKQPVLANEFEYVYRKNNQSKPAEFTQPKIEEYLNLYINFKLKVRDAYSQGLDTTAAFRKEYATYRDELRKPYLATSDELDKLTRETYERLQEEVNASHILVMVAADAVPADTLRAYERISAIRKRLIAGEDFAAVARETSEDPSAASNGGNLGYFTALQMVFPFEDAAYRLQPGDLSEPVRTRFGYHLVKLHHRQKARGEVEVSHILLRGNEPKVRNKAFEIMEQLKKGRSWDELCREFSEDAATRESGGRLRPFGVGALSAVPEFEAVAFSLQNSGDVSDPFSSAIGWHLVRLEKRMPLPTYSELEPSLKRRVSRDERLQISKVRSLEKRKREFGLTENLALIDSVRARVDTALTNGRWKLAAPLAWRQQAVATLPGRSLPVQQLVDYLERNQKTTALSPREFFQQLYTDFVGEEINEEEDRQLLANNEEYRNLIAEYREGMLMFSIMEKEVWNLASADTVGQLKHYEANKSQYKAGERVRARVISASSKTILEDIKSKIQKGDTLKPDDIRKLKSFGSMRPYARGENPGVDRVSWAAGLHETETDGIFYLIEVESLVPPGIQPFSEVKAQVITEYQEALEKQWLLRLREKYPVKVNKKVKKQVMATLTQKTS
jgi:peptidyl-prolyl cis-trans isomerase SurA